MSAHTKLADQAIGPLEIYDDGSSIDSDQSIGMVTIDETTAETRTLPAPAKAGQVLYLVKSVSDNQVAFTQAESATFDGSNTTLTIDDIGFARLVSINPDSPKWAIIASDEDTNFALS